MKTTTTVSRASLLAITLGLLAATSTAHAQTFTGSVALPSDFGNLSQYNSGITVTNNQNIQPQACVPTSVINGLTYLDNYYDQSIFSQNPGTYAAINSIATSMGTANTPGVNTGTGYGPGINGLNSFIATNGNNPNLAVSVYGQYPAGWGGGVPNNTNFQQAIPTANYLTTALNANDAVQICIWWGSVSGGVFTPTVNGGTHEISLYSMSFNMGTGAGSAGIVVPESAAGTYPDQNAFAQNLPGSALSAATYGGSSYLFLTYSDVQTISGTPGETGEPNSSIPLNQTAGTGGGSSPAGLIIADYVEAVPEPSSFALLALGLVPVLVLAARRHSLR